MITVKVVAQGKRQDGTPWTRLQKMQDTELGELPMTAFIGNDNLEVAGVREVWGHSPPFYRRVGSIA